MSKKITPAAIYCLKEALINAFWYKPDLRGFLVNSLENPGIISRLNWNDYKRNIVGNLIDNLYKNENKYQADLIILMNHVSELSDFSHLRKLEDGKIKEKRAQEAISALKEQMKGYQEIGREKENAEKRRAESYKRLMQIQEVQRKLDEVRLRYLELIKDENTQKRGYLLEKILKEIFELFDLDPKASFKIVGEQIDGAFSFEGTDYLLEAKWQSKLVIASDLDSLIGKLSRKLDNTLGLYLSILGYSGDAVKSVSSGRRLLLLMDGSDLMAVLDGRIDLVQLLLRKRRKAAETGNIYLKINEILG